MNMGIDSLTSLTFVEALQVRTGLQLSPTLIFDHPTAEAVSQHINELTGRRGASQLPGDLAAEGWGRGCAAQPAVAAVIGRWPSGAASGEALWRLSETGCDAIGTVPAQRWAVGTVGDAQWPAARFLATVRGAALFDSAHFSVSPAEAASMDPQQRLLLEYGYTALVTGGLSRVSLQGSDTGVFLGITNADFHTMLLAASTSVYTATGGTISIAAGRMSFTLGLHGPCESLDTACSSAVVALHSAALCLAFNDCPVALTTAVSLMLTPHVSISYARAGMLSSDGRCKTFDVSANGYVRGEGVGGVVGHLTQLKDQLSIGSSAVQQDGMSASLTAPNGSVQVTLLSLANARAVTGDAALHCGIESHGTGTPLGDPTEVRALAKALLVQEAERVLRGIKANVGHLEPTAGMVGMLHSIHMLLELSMTSNAQLRVLNPHLAESASAGLSYPSAVGRLRMVDCAIVGTSSFGYSGTIAHVVLTSNCDAPTTKSIPALASFRKCAFAWETPRLHASSAALPVPPTSHTPFLGIPIAAPSGGDLLWEQRFAPYELAFLQNHRVGQVALLPGTCYIEMARAMVRVVHDATAFALTSVAFTTIMFLDDELDGEPIARVAVERAEGVLTITSRREESSWDTHSNMVLELRSVEPGSVDVSAVQARCHEHVTHSEFYATCGNDYHGEFKAMDSGWARDGGIEILSKVVYSHNETQHLHLRTCAWLDTCLHAPYWWSNHCCRPFYIAAVKSYAINSMDCTQNQVMWSLMHGLGGSEDLQPEVLKYHSDDLMCRVQIDGSRLGFFDIGWLEARRTQRHLFELSWTPKQTDSSSTPAHKLIVASSGFHAGAADVSLIQHLYMPLGCINILYKGDQHGKHHADQLSALGDALSLIQLASLPAIWLITTATQATSAERACWLRVSHAGLWGLSRAARQEMPNLGLWNVDVYASSQIDVWSSLASVCVPQSPEPEVAQSGGGVVCASLVRECFGKAGLRPSCKRLLRRGDPRHFGWHRCSWRTDCALAGRQWSEAADSSFTQRQKWTWQEPKLGKASDRLGCAVS
jgi:3-oxoacyl-(acyl-carrier-protein) synthase